MAKVFTGVLLVASAEQPDFDIWAASYGFVYNGAERDLRRAVYDANVATIDAHNAEQTSYKMAVNAFAAMEADEFAATMLGRQTASADVPALAVHEWDGQPLAESIDWTTQGAVTAIKDQGSCGSCWSFAATGGLEGALATATGTLVALSEQQFMDCDKGETEGGGCGGGLEYDAWNFFKKRNEGICTESSYPYTARSGTCQYSSCTLGIAAGGIAGVTNVGGAPDVQTTEANLKSALNQQPVAVGVQASAWQFYTSGILSGSCSGSLDHSVLAVGYVDGSHWKVKNSWGKSWGENGFIRVEMSGDKCGILEDASFPTVTGAAVSV